MKRQGRCSVALVLFILGITGSIRAQGERIEVRVDGLACPFCAYGLEKKLKGMEGVKALSINLEAGLVEITMREGSSVDREEIRKRVENAGFTPVEIRVEEGVDRPKPGVKTVTLAIEGMKCEGCALRIQSALDEDPGVYGAEVSLELGRAVIEYDGDVTNPARLIGWIEKAGPFQAGRERNWDINRFQDRSWG